MLLKEKKEIEKWLDKFEIKHYELIADDKYGYVVNVSDNVKLRSRRLNKIEIKFNIVKGWFNCDYNELESLEGCPKIIEKDFSCNGNNLINLMGCPEIINGNFYCSNNELKSLKGLPKKIKGELFLNNNNLSIKEMNEIKFLEECDIINLQGNEMLGELQYVNDINEIKKILNIYEEKTKLNSLIIINDDEIIKENRIKIKIKI